MQKNHNSMTKLTPPLSFLVEYTSEEFPEGSRSYSVGAPEEVRKAIEENKWQITRVLLTDRTKKDGEFLQMFIKQDMYWYRLQKELEDDPFTSHQN